MMALAKKGLNVSTKNKSSRRPSVLIQAKDCLFVLNGSVFSLLEKIKSNPGQANDSYIDATDSAIMVHRSICLLEQHDLLTRNIEKKNGRKRRVFYPNDFSRLNLINVGSRANDRFAATKRSTLIKVEGQYVMLPKRLCAVLGGDTTEKRNTIQQYHSLLKVNGLMDKTTNEPKSFTVVDYVGVNYVGVNSQRKRNESNTNRNRRL